MATAAMTMLSFTAIVWRLFVLASLLGLACILFVTGLNLSARWFWLGEIAVSFLWIQVLFGLAVAVMLLSSRWRLLLLPCLMCVTWSGTQLAPYFPVNSNGTVSRNTPSLRIMQANVAAGNSRPDLSLKGVIDTAADVVCFQEVNFSWDKYLQALQGTYPYHKSFPQDGCFGSAIYSKFPLHDISHKDLNGASVTTVSIEMERTRVMVVNVHTYPPMTPHLFRTRNNQLDLLAEYVATLPGPLLVVGDLNVTMWSPHYRKFIERTELIDPRLGTGLLLTFGARHSLPLPLVPIDYILCSPGLEFLHIERGQRTNSDHYPVFADLRLNSKKSPSTSNAR